jgi:chromosome partitioning protein
MFGMNKLSNPRHLRPPPLDLDAIPATVRIARNSGKPFFVLINATAVQGVETEATRAALTSAGAEVAPMVLHQRKACCPDAGRRTTPEIEPKGKAAEEVRELPL